MVGWVMLVQLAGGRLDMSAGGRRCRGVPPLRGGIFLNTRNLRDVVLSFGMLV